MYKIEKKIDIILKSKAIRQINFSLHSYNQNDHMSSLYLKNIFDCVNELDGITISYRLWNLESIEKNAINNVKRLIK